MSAEQRRRDAVLLAVYALAGGRPGVPVDPLETFAYVRQHGLIDMSDDEYDAFHDAVVARVRAERESAAGGAS